MKKQIKLKQIKKYLVEGKTYEEIGEIFGVTRQRIEQILHPLGLPVYQRKPIKIIAKFIGNSTFLKNEIYELLLTEKIKPKGEDKLMFFLESANQNFKINITYYGIEELLKDWEAISKI